MSVAINIEHAVKRFGDKTIIPDLCLHVKEGEFFTLLGSSGCGKTTLLRMIAGFNTIEGGDFYFNDKRINDLPPHTRNIGMVFQNYAIFPHMSAGKNVGYGLKQRKVKEPELSRRGGRDVKRRANFGFERPDAFEYVWRSAATNCAGKSDCHPTGCPVNGRTTVQSGRQAAD